MPVVRAAVKDAPTKTLRAVAKPKAATPAAAAPKDVLSSVIDRLGKSIAEKKFAAEKEYYDLQEKYYKASAVLRGYSATNEARIKTWCDEIKKVSALPFVENVELVGFNLVVSTKSLEMSGKDRNDGKNEVRILGCLKIDIDLLTSLVRITNTTHPGKSYSAPHCPKGLTPCYGTMATAVPELMARGDLSTFIGILSELFTRPNVGDAWGSHFYDFPLKKG